MLDLTKYSEQELEALRKAISEEQGKRESPYKIGDCFCFKYEDVIFLIKVINLENDLCVCEEISIGSDNTTDIYTSDYCYDDLKNCIYINPAFYTKVANIIKEKQEAINEIITKFENNISRLLIDLKDYVDC